MCGLAGVCHVSEYVFMPVSIYIFDHLFSYFLSIVLIDPLPIINVMFDVVRLPRCVLLFGISKYISHCVCVCLDFICVFVSYMKVCNRYGELFRSVFHLRSLYFFYRSLSFLCINLHFPCSCIYCCLLFLFVCIMLNVDFVSSFVYFILFEQYFD